MITKDDAQKVQELINGQKKFLSKSQLDAKNYTVVAHSSSECYCGDSTSNVAVSCVFNEDTLHLEKNPIPRLICDNNSASQVIIDVASYQNNIQTWNYFDYKQCCT